MSSTDILLVEDNPGDIQLIERAFEEQEIAGTLHITQAGDEALDWVHQREEFSEAPSPDLVLLDLNLSAISGHTVLKEIKSDPQLKWLPVIVLTGSRSETELREAYEEHANSCVTKPVDPDEFIDLIQTFAEFWIVTAELPSVSGSTAGPRR